jgi:hypothetical protein
LEVEMGHDPQSKTFIPLGAIAFLFTVILVYAGIWFSIFALMAARG